MENKKFVCDHLKKKKKRDTSNICHRVCVFIYDLIVHALFGFRSSLYTYVMRETEIQPKMKWTQNRRQSFPFNVNAVTRRRRVPRPKCVSLVLHHRYEGGEAYGSL